MYTSPATLTLGFHGCDRAVGEHILQGKIHHLRKSENRYDWLGHGIYFWENNPARALQFARERHSDSAVATPLIKDPFVIGAVIDLGNGLNLLESDSLQLVAQAYKELHSFTIDGGTELPENKVDKRSGELLQRDLDCAVIEMLHVLNDEAPFDTVRGVFTEGRELYPNAGFRERNHIQICIRNTACIKGYFRLQPGM